MKHKRLKTLVLLLGAGLLGIHAQNMYVQENSGTKTTYVLDDIQKLSFADGNLTIDKTGNSKVYALSDLRYINFQEFTVNLAETKAIGESMSIYPNPANHLLNIALKGEASGTISIINLEGQVMETIQANRAGLVSIDISHLPNGFYICRHINDKETKTIKFIKQ